MSAYGYKRTFSHLVIYVCFTPESGHFSALAFMSAYDPKRTFIGFYGSVVIQAIFSFTRHSSWGQDSGLTLSEIYSELLMAKRKHKRRRHTILRDGPDPVDVHVGGRVREHRVSLGMSQGKLGEYLRLTFQQIQKYEKGTNRISASKLWTLSHFFKVPVEWFFEGLGEAGKGQEDMVTRLEARQLARYYQACPPPTKKSLLALIRATAGVRGKGGRRTGRGQ